MRVEEAGGWRSDANGPLATGKEIFGLPCFNTLVLSSGNDLLLKMPLRGGYWPGDGTIRFPCRIIPAFCNGFQGSAHYSHTAPKLLFQTSTHKGALDVSRHLV